MTILPFLAKINNLVIRSDYLRKVAAAIASDEDSVVEEFKKYLKTENGVIPIRKESKDEVEKGDLRERLEERLMTLILRMKKPKVAIKLLDWQTLRFKKIGQVIRKFKKFDAEKVVRKLDAELIESFNNLYFDLP